MLNRLIATLALIGLFFWSPVSPTACAQDADSGHAMLRVGMVGLDTSHAPAFTKLFNSDDARGSLARMRVVSAFPDGSPDLSDSADRIEGFTEQLRGMGVDIVESMDALLEDVDVVLIESVDGRKHLRQALPVFKAGKPVFIDKPLAASLVDAIAIDLLAKKYNARWFSSSSLRFSSDYIRFREDPQLRQQVVGASSWGPCSLEPRHTDLYWYGVHGVEMLYTAMDVGCESVSRVHTDGIDVVVGTWKGGRVGSFRGIREGAKGYGMLIFGKEKIELAGRSEGYGLLTQRIGDFFLGGPLPVSNQETLEMFTFMQAADASRDAGGRQVRLDSVWESAMAEAEKLVHQLDP